MYLVQISNQVQEVGGMYWDLTQSQFVSVVTTGLLIPTDMAQAFGSSSDLMCTAVQDPSTREWIHNVSEQSAVQLFAQCNQQPGFW
jgi:hypothetical protein